MSAAVCADLDFGMVCKVLQPFVGDCCDRGCVSKPIPEVLLERAEAIANCLPAMHFEARPKDGARVKGWRFLKAPGHDGAELRVERHGDRAVR
jgi:hypothetical protein